MPRLFLLILSLILLPACFTLKISSPSLSVDYQQLGASAENYYPLNFQSAYQESEISVGYQYLWFLPLAETVIIEPDKFILKSVFQLSAENNYRLHLVSSDQLANQIKLTKVALNVYDLIFIRLVSLELGLLTANQLVPLMPTTAPTNFYDCGSHKFYWFLMPMAAELQNILSKQSKETVSNCLNLPQL